MLATLRQAVRAASFCSIVTASLPGASAQVERDWLIHYRDPALPGASDYADATAVAGNGDVYVGGYSILFPVFSSSLSKYDSSGTLQWRRVHAPVETQWLQAHAIPSGGAYFVGSLWSPMSGTHDYVVTRVDTAGNLVWMDTYAAQDSSADYARSAIDLAGNLVIGGSDSLHDLVFARSYSPSGALNFHGDTTGVGYPRLWTNVAALHDGGVVFGAWSIAGGIACCFSGTGALAWLHTYRNSFVYSVEVDPATGDVIVGTSTQNGSGDPLLERVDALGNVLWSDASMGGAVFDLAFASDGALWAAGVGAGGRELVMRYDASGTRTAMHLAFARGGWARSIVPGNAGQVWTSVQRRLSNLSGQCQVEQFDASGQLNWRMLLSRPSWMTLAGAAGGRVVASGWAFNGGGDIDGLVEQLDASEAPDGYCTAQVNSLGCTPALIFAGNSSASEASGFVVSVNRVLNQKTGVFFCGTSGVASIPFHGGTKCVAGPLHRSALLNSGGNASPVNDCSGVLSIDFNAFASNSTALSQPGTTVYVQAWSHDDAGPSTTNLSSALHFVVLP